MSPTVRYKTAPVAARHVSYW